MPVEITFGGVWQLPKATTVTFGAAMYLCRNSLTRRIPEVDQHELEFVDLAIGAAPFLVGCEALDALHGTLSSCFAGVCLQAKTEGRHDKIVFRFTPAVVEGGGAPDDACPRRGGGSRYPSAGHHCAGGRCGWRRRSGQRRLA